MTSIDVVSARRVWLDSGRRVCGFRDVPGGLLAPAKAAHVLTTYLSWRPGMTLTEDLQQPDPRVKLWVARASLDTIAMVLVVGLRYGSCWYVAEDRSLL